MAKTTTNPFTQTIKTPAQVLLNADGAIGTSDYGTAPSNTKLLLTAGSEGSIVKSLIVNSNDTTTRTLQFFLSLDSGVTKYLLFTVATPANAGFTTVASVDILAASTTVGLPIDQSGRPVLPLEAEAQIYFGSTVAVNSARTIYAKAILEDF